MDRGTWTEDLSSPCRPRGSAFCGPVCSRRIPVALGHNADLSRENRSEVELAWRVRWEADRAPTDGAVESDYVLGGWAVTRLGGLPVWRQLSGEDDATPMISIGSLGFEQDRR